MDILSRAQARREALKAELARIEAFLATAYELQQELTAAAPATQASDKVKADAPSRMTGRGGIGAETLSAVREILIDRGQPMSTRELLPLVLARGIEVGGKDALATLSARISQKGVVTLYRGKWWLKEFEKEAANTPNVGASAASNFGVSQGGPHNAAALAN